MYKTTKYNPGGGRRFNLTTIKNGVRSPNFSYAVSRPYTPRMIPNVTSSLASRFGPGKEQKFFHTHQPVAGTWVADPCVDIKTDGYFLPLFQRNTGSASGSLQYEYLKCGSGPSERIGLKITLKKIKLHGALLFGHHSDDAHGGSVRYRIMVVEDRQANGATLTHANTTQLLKSSTVDSQLNPIYASKFRVHYDRLIDPNLTRVAAEGGNGMQAFQFSPKAINFSFEKTFNQLITYQGTTGDLAELVNVSFYLFVICDKNTGATVGEDRVDLDFNYEAMLYFDDF